MRSRRREFMDQAIATAATMRIVANGSLPFPSMCCDAASVAKRGSRFVGLDSRRNVSALVLLALEAQEEQNAATTQRSNEGTRRALRWHVARSPGRESRRYRRNLPRWRIGHFTEDRWPSRACGRGKVGRALMERFVGHQREGEGLFCRGGDAQVVGREDFDRARFFR